MYNIERLTAFNPALVYGFSPETCAKSLLGSEHYQDNMYLTTGQHLDVLNAYLYAQDTILPFILSQGIEAITEELLLTWILKLHQNIGKTLLPASGGIAGEYSTGEVVRWQQGGEVYFDLADLFNDMLNFKAHKKHFIQNYSTKFKLEIKTCTTFVEIIERFREESITELAGKINPFQKNPELVTSIINKITAARRQGLLSAKETKALDEIVIFCRPPAEIPAAMRDFAKNTLLQWQACKTVSQKEKADKIAAIFYQLTEIHPFINANGRTATCLINIILKSLDLPDILLRIPGDREDEESDYSKAIAAIMETRAPLAQHIYNCIEQAKQKPFEDKKLAEVIRLRVEYTLNCQALEKKYPAFNVETFRKEVEKEIAKTKVSGDYQDYTITALKMCLEMTIKAEEKLLASSIAQLKLFAAPLNPLTRYKKALELYTDKQYEKAITLFILALDGFKEKTVDVSQELAKSYSALASAYRDSDKLDLAVKACADSLASLEDSKNSEELLSKVLIKYTQCLTLHKAMPSAVYDTAVTDFKNKHFQGALCQLQYCLEKWKAISGSDNQLASCYSTMASCQRDLGLITEALTSCEEALKLCVEGSDKFLAIQQKQESIKAKQAPTLEGGPG